MNTQKASFYSLFPFIIFISLFLFSSLLFVKPISPLVACSLAVMFAICAMHPLPLNNRIQLFLHGAANNTIIAMCYIYILSAVFIYCLKLIGGIESAITVGLYLIPQSLVLPGFFLTVSLFAIAIGSSMGAIAAFIPIANGLASSLNVDPALFAGIVVSGAMLGDNLSLISDTTIAATQTTQTSMADKFKENSLLVVPAALIATGILFWLNKGLVSVPEILHSVPTVHDFIVLIPYGVLFAIALYGIDVIAVLSLSIISAIAIGLANGTITIAQSFSIILDGFIDAGTGIQEVLILSLVIAGLTYLVEYNGGIEYILQKMSQHITSRKTAELHIVLLVFLVNAAVAINTIAILVTGPIAKKIGDLFGIPGKRVASLLDTIACFCQGILPYAPQLLLAGSIAGVSSISIMPYLHYQWAIFLVTLVSIMYPSKNPPLKA